MQLGLLPLPKTANPNHMKNNAELEFIISDSEMEYLKTIKKISDYGEAGKFPVYAVHE